jgi:hypothetical protein
VHFIEKELGLPIQLAPKPQVAGALGAALLGLEEYRANLREGAANRDEEDLTDADLQASRPCAPGCKGQPNAVAERPVVLQDNRIPVHRN